MVAHTQEFDSRFPAVGLATKDESLLLYNYARQFQGQDMLEIGCWIGWSTLVLAMGGVRLTVIDPVLGETAPGETCRQAIKEAGLADSVKFIGGFSPQEVTKLNAQGYTWSLCFIDGNHDGDAPLLDAQEVVHSARENSMILFHDVIQPNVGDALLWLKREGWNVGVHHTCWFLGVAWRGTAKPLTHSPDPKVDWERIIRNDRPHLATLPRL